MRNSPLRNEEKASLALRALYAAYGYAPFKMSKFEEYELYLRNKNFLISDQIITFTDTSGKLMALKPDVTLSIVKNAKDTPDSLYKVYYNESVYRVSGRSASFCEIMQTGLEAIGDVDTYCLAEVITLAAKSLEALSADSVLTLSDLDVLSAAIRLTGVSASKEKALFKLIGEKNSHGIDALLTEEGLDCGKGSVIKALLDCYGTPREVFLTLASFDLPDEVKAPLASLEALLSSVDSDKLCIDFSAVSDARYYNGVVFQGFVKGVPSAILSGGRYDKLMSRMGRASRGVGFAVYLDLLEELDRSSPDFDYDTVVLYESDADCATVTDTVKCLIEKGETVLAAKALPQKKRYRRVLKINRDGGTVL